MILEASAAQEERGGLALTWSRLFVRALSGAGIRHAVVSPGSRSTPLALALAEQSDGGDGAIACEVVVDERCAAFFALGIARATGEPALLVCTSGTAAAHYFPAVIEASTSGVPLVVVTADRPWELHETGALQTIDQTKLFGAHVRHAFDLGVPDPSPQSLRAVMRVGAAAVLRARSPMPGPVHVNAHFRKPLEPVLAAGPLAGWEEEARALLARGATRVVSARSSAHVPAIVDELVEALGQKRGLIVCGPTSAHGDPNAKRRALIALARATGFAVACESTSQVRFGAPAEGVVEAPCLEDLFADLALHGENAPEVVLQLGEVPTSAAYARWIARSPTAKRIVISPRTWADPEGDAAIIVFAEPWSFARELAEALFAAHPPRLEATGLDHFAVTLKQAASSARFDERAIARALVEHLDARGSTALPSTLMIANSRSIRAIDAASAGTKHALRVLHQRGASGIDGLISGAVGARRVLEGAMALLIGDLAALHDIGGLALARAAGGPLPIVVANNGGGLIFADLPVAKAVAPATLERFFLTPTPIDFASAAKTFGLAYARAETTAELADALSQAQNAKAPVVIEAVVQARSHSPCSSTRDLQ